MLLWTNCKFLNMTSLIFRWLTAVYYANQDWSESDGGVLRL